jgi:site-specific recombinase XerD
VPGSDDASLRARALLELLYATGIRCAELVGLDLAEVDLDARMVRVLGKGGRSAWCPSEAARARRWWPTCPPARGRRRARTPCS